MDTWTDQELRCFCTRNPLLALYGIDAKGKLYVHVKIHKQKRIFTEILVVEGIVKIRCRECLRWHTVKIVSPSKVILEESSIPDKLVD